MIVVDTTVLVYAAGGPHALREPSRRFFDAVVAERVVATTTLEVIQEFTHAFARRRPRAEAAEQARRYATILSPLLAGDAGHIPPALRLFETHERLDAFDSFLAAAAIEAGADALVSADAAFASLAELAHAAPGSEAFERLLAR